ncbi:MAG: molybdopterin-dependent oxidoreductase [Chloroflexota bacterium]
MASSGETIVKSTCRMCHGVCGVLVHLKDGRVTKITGDPDCPTSQGYTCTKGRASPELLYHPDRLHYPLKRAGARGENKWQRISWDEALDTVASEFLRVKKEHGVLSIAATSGTGRPYSVLFGRFVRALGTPNRFGGGHICYSPRLASSAMTCGNLPICDYYGFGGVYPKCVIVWGCNVILAGASDGMCGHQLSQTMRRPDTKTIVIDPRKVATAAKADQWLQIRPGTDDALALGMLNVIIGEKLYDKDFVANWTVGFDELSERVAKYTPERVSEITWIPAEQIREAARTYATTKPACIQWGVSVDQNINNFQTSRAILCLSAITGNLDVPGGDVFWVPPEKIVVQAPRLNPAMSGPPIPPEIAAQRIGVDRYRILPQVHPYDFYETAITGKPYPIKALFVMGANMLVARSAPEKIIKAMQNIDFIVATELFMTPTTQYADIVLPASSWLEQDDVADMHFIWCVLLRQNVATIGECRDDKQIVIDLARRMGLEDVFPWRTVREYCDWVLKPAGLTFEDFKKIGILKGKMRYRKYEQDGFATPSGKVELSSSQVAALGYDPLPDYVEPPESPYSTPEVFKDFPLIMTTGARYEGYFHSEGRQIKSLRQRDPEPFVDIHPDTARKLGIGAGDMVWIESPRGGRIQMRAHLWDGIHPGVVHAPHGWWFPEKGPPEYGYRDANANMLTGDIPFDPHTGSESWRSFLCKVYRA